MDLFSFIGLVLEAIWIIVSSFPSLTFIMLMFFSGLIIYSVIVNLHRQKKLRKSGILEIDEMTGRQFEEYLQILMKQKGYNVKLTSKAGDFGADLILHSPDKKIIVQAKRYKKRVGIKAVQEIASAKNHYLADECWVITNNYFTEPAIKLAKSNNVMLINRNTLIEWMLEMNIDAS